MHVFTDRIERSLAGRGAGWNTTAIVLAYCTMGLSLLAMRPSSGMRATEVIPASQITTIQPLRHGGLTVVNVITAGNAIPEAAADELRERSAAEDMKEVLITLEARARVATALRVLRILTEDTTRSPDWPYRGEALRALADIAAVLDRIDPATEA